MNLQTFFEQHPEAAIAFSGGADSAYLLYAASLYAKRFKAYYVRSAFQPLFEYEDALRLARELKAELEILEMDILDAAEVRENSAERCYYCKQAIFRRILAAARQDGFTLLLDGSNATDDAGDRPGMRALRELEVRSPLREAGLSKAEIRARSREAGLFTWNKPAYACLATRIPTGEAITSEALAKTERAEAYLQSLGLRDFRVRLRQGAALLQLRAEDWPLFMQRHREISEQLKKDYTAVFLDTEVRKGE